MVNFLLQNVGPAAIQFAAEAIRTRPVGVQGGGDQGHGDDGCPACQLHADLAESERLLAAMVLKADGDGRVPAHIAATVLLVDQHLRLAQGRLDAITSERPDLARQAGDLAVDVRAARAALPGRADVDGERARASQAQVEGCWRGAVDLADAYFAPAPALTERDKVLEWVASLPPAERRSFVAALTS